MERLRTIPLLSSLSRRAFAELAASVKRRALGEDEVLFFEGQPARSFFIIVEGELEVARRTVGGGGQIRRAGPDDVLGIFGLFSGRRRAATVRALGPVVVLEVPGTTIARLVQRHASVRTAVRSFYQQRLISLFLSGAPVFGELPEATRADIAGRFQARDLGSRKLLVTAGETVNGLFLVMNGQVVLRRHQAGGAGEELLRFGRGQYFGVVSALIGRPCPVSAVTPDGCSLAVLAHPQIAALLRKQPALATLPERVREEGLLVARGVFVGDTGVPVGGAGA